MSETTGMVLAQQRARRLYKSSQFIDLYVRGARARFQGRPRSSCPYPASVKKSWNTTRRRAWLRGFDSAEGAANV